MKEKVKDGRMITETSREKVLSSAMTRRNSCETSMYERSIRELSEKKYRREKKLKENNKNDKNYKNNEIYQVLYV